MFKSFKAKILAELIEFLLKQVSGAMLQKVADAILDQVENLVESTETPYDDKLVLPMVAKVREVFGIPDDDTPPEA